VICKLSVNIRGSMKIWVFAIPHRKDLVNVRRLTMGFSYGTTQVPSETRGEGFPSSVGSLGYVSRRVRDTEIATNLSR